MQSVKTHNYFSPGAGSRSRTGGCCILATQVPPALKASVMLCSEDTHLCLWGHRVGTQQLGMGTSALLPLAHVACPTSSDGFATAVPLVRTSLAPRTCSAPTATTHRNISVEKQAHHQMSDTNTLQDREKALLSHPLVVTLHPS